MSDATTPAPEAAPVVAPPVAVPVVAPPVQVAPPVVAPAPPAPPAVAAEATTAAPVVAPDLAALTADVAALRGVLAKTVAHDLAAVPESVRKAVLEIAGDDPVRQRTTLDAMRAHGLATAPSQQPIPPGATTHPTAGAAAPSAPASTAPGASELAEYERLRTIAPMRAEAFRSSNSAAIAAALKARAPTN